MSFWRYCEKVQEIVGDGIVIDQISLIRKCWNEKKSIEECVEKLRGK